MLPPPVAELGHERGCVRQDQHSVAARLPYTKGLCLPPFEKRKGWGSLSADGASVGQPAFLLLFGILRLGSNSSLSPAQRPPGGDSVLGERLAKGIA
jgi:hypothetical protein